MELHFFDRNQSAAILERKLPHWSQPGVVCFATFRTHDSMPVPVVEQWHGARRDWLRRHQINPEVSDWRVRIRDLSPDTQQEFFAQFSTRWHTELDQCHGACVLKNQANAAIVKDALLKFHGDRYLLSHFVVMPNHVHLLIAFPDDQTMLKQFEDWKRFIARMIHQRMGTSGRFWQQDGFDHLVRSEAQFHHFKNYIANNPKKAGLKSGEFIHWTESPK